MSATETNQIDGLSVRVEIVEVFRGEAMLL